jgi:hypothetical protein
MQKDKGGEVLVHNRNRLIQAFSKMDFYFLTFLMNPLDEERRGCQDDCFTYGWRQIFMKKTQQVKLLIG